MLPVVKSPKSEPSVPEEAEPPGLDQEAFLRTLGLVTHAVAAETREMQGRRKTRNRKSTADPNYIWGTIGVSFDHFFYLVASFQNCKFE